MCVRHAFLSPSSTGPRPVGLAFLRCGPLALVAPSSAFASFRSRSGPRGAVARSVVAAGRIRLVRLGLSRSCLGPADFGAMGVRLWQAWFRILIAHRRRAITTRRCRLRSSLGFSSRYRRVGCPAFDGFLLLSLFLFFDHAEHVML